MKLKIVTPEKTTYENEIFQVSIPTTTGEITILPHHISLVTVLIAGELKIKDSSGEQFIAVAGGFVEIRSNDEIIILADNAERAEDIDIQRAEEARKRAEEQMKQTKISEDIDFAKLQAIIDREVNRVRIAKKYRKLP